MDDNWDDYTQFRDTIHGYIKIPKPLVKRIINTPFFQRLKNIEQTGMRVLFPSATHNRFSHTLGVYYLGSKAFKNFVDNIRRKETEDGCYFFGADDNESRDLAKHRWNMWGVLFKLACLLHDIGHSPFSHSLEMIYDCDFSGEELSGPENSKMNIKLMKEIINEKSKIDFLKKVNSGRSQHERMSALLVFTEFKKPIKELVDSYWKYKYDKIDYNTENDFEDDLEFIARMITGCFYEWEEHGMEYFKNRNIPSPPIDTWSRELQLRNCVINILNSAIDVDNLDYTTRDTINSGYSNSTVDIERILNSFTVMKVYDCKQAKVYFAADIPIQNPVDCRVFDGNEFGVYLTGKCHFTFQKYEKNKGRIKIEKKGKDSEQIEYEEFSLDEGFSGRVIYDPEESKSNTILLTPKGKSGEPGDDAQLRLKGRMKGEFTGKIFGNIDEKVFMSEKNLQNVDEIAEKEEKKYAIKYYQFAYDKGCQSVIDGALSARNFEHLWIYAHHTVTYYTNYFTNYLLEKYCCVLYEREIKNISVNLKEIFDGQKPVSYTGDLELDGKSRDLDYIKNLIVEIIRIFFSYRVERLLKKKSVEFLEKYKKLNENLKRLLDELQKADGKKTVEIKEIIGEVPEARGIHGISTPDYLRVDDVSLGNILEGIKENVKYVTILLEWLLFFSNFYKETELSQIDNEYKDILQNFEETVNILDKFMNNEADGKDKIICNQLFGLNEIEETKLQIDRINGRELKYMCDVIAMPKKNKILGITYNMSSDDNLETYYHILKNEIEDKKEEKRTSNEQKFYEVADEYFSRDFAFSMWKTFAEYKHIFHDWQDKEIEYVLNVLDNKHIPIGTSSTDNKIPYGKYCVFSENFGSSKSDEWCYNEFYKKVQQEEYNIKRLIFVRQSVMATSLNPYETFFVLRGDDVLRISDIDLFNKTNVKDDFFYFYYKTKDGKALAKEKILSLIDEFHEATRSAMKKRPPEISGVE